MLRCGERRDGPPAMHLDTAFVRPFNGIRGTVASIEAKRTALIEEQEAKWLVHTLIEGTGTHRDEEDFFDLIYEGAQTLARLKPCWWKTQVLHGCHWMGWLQYGAQGGEYENISPMQLAGLAALGPPVVERQQEEALLTDKLFLTKETQARLKELFSGTDNTALDLGEAMATAARGRDRGRAEDRGKEQGRRPREGNAERSHGPMHRPGRRG